MSLYIQRFVMVAVRSQCHSIISYMYSYFRYESSSLTHEHVSFIFFNLLLEDSIWHIVMNSHSRYSSFGYKTMHDLTV